MKKVTILLTLLLSLLVLAGCGGNEKKTSGTTNNTIPNVLKIGVTAGPHAEIMDNVKKLAAKQGLKIEVVEFSDYVSPNVALFQGELFANSMQHAPYLQATLKKEPKFDLKECFKTVNFPMAVYSTKVKKGNAIPDGAIIAIPNDPSNRGRALLLLANAGLITVKDINNVTTSLADITENKHNFKFKELDAATIPRSMDDVTVAVINANYALSAGLNPTKDSILLESAKNPFVNIFVTKAQNVDSKEIAKLKAIYQSPENEKFILDHFKGTILPAWK
ncbi:MAG: MetQ/NlpA family ABC transporter substrate-binding protein [Acidaminococcaceae bacterium]|nr:MetQ/NlpA family ABC transporter substrate-binding protein [Acidaminococcaceae bacterium]